MGGGPDPPAVQDTMSQTPPSPTPAGPRVLLLSALDRWVFQNFVPSLRRLSSRVYAYPLGDTMGNWHIPNWRDQRPKLVDRLTSDIAALAKAGWGPDLILAVVYDDLLRPGDVRRLRDLGCRVVNYHVDMNAQWYRVLHHGPELDLLAVSHLQNLEPLIRRGIPLHFMPMAASPDRYLAPEPPVGGGEGDPGVLMLGSATTERARAVAACREVTERVDVYGGGWDRLLDPAAATGGAAIDQPVPQPLAKRLLDLSYLVPRLMCEGMSMFGRFRDTRAVLDAATIRRAATARLHGSASDNQVPGLLGRAAITLGVNQRRGRIGDRLGFADSRLRDFEAPLSGAFYLVQSYMDLPLFYRPGAEVETWSSLPELQEKVRHYLNHPRERAAIARAGRERAIREHTWDSRLHGLFHRLGLAHREPGAPCPLEVLVNLSSSPWCHGSPGCKPTDGDVTAEPRLPGLSRDAV